MNDSTGRPERQVDTYLTVVTMVAPSSSKAMWASMRGGEAGRCSSLEMCRLLEMVALGCMVALLLYNTLHSA